MSASVRLASHKTHYPNAVRRIRSFELTIHRFLAICTVSSAGISLLISCGQLDSTGCLMQPEMNWRSCSHPAVGYLLLLPYLSSEFPDPQMPAFVSGGSLVRKQVIHGCILKCLTTSAEISKSTTRGGKTMTIERK